MIEQAIDIASAGIGQKAGGDQRFVERVINLTLQAVMTQQAFGHLIEFDGDNALECIGPQWAEDQCLEASQQCSMEVLA
ncbi:hypothetical protein D3C79_913570 [compost metagenome]